MGRLKILVLCLFIISCKSQPTIEKARAFYSKVFPNHKILQIEIDEDEVACRTFHLKVQNESNQIMYKYILFFYEENNGRKWVLFENSY